MKVSATFLASMLIPLGLGAAETVNWEASLGGIASSGDFSPYYINSLTHGRYSQGYTLQAEAAAWRPLDTSRRFSWGYGADVIAGATSSVGYERYDGATQKWFTHSERPSAVWLQQLYGEVKYRSVFLYAGMKEETSALLNQKLTSGDLIESGNTRPIPQVRAGFIDFQDIPFTDGWVQIQGEVAYGRMLQDGWLRDHYNYYNYHITTGAIYYNYKRCFFRTKPSKPLSLTIGMQAAGIFGGYNRYYKKGELTKVLRHSTKLKTFFKMLIPTEDGGDAFYTGSNLGCWDINLRYRFPSGHEVKAYTQWLWEDGSGIGKLNGLDGLWGLEYKAPRKGYISGAVIEYFDFTNQSGPLHFAPGDFEGTTITDHASGGDDYYNNYTQNSYAYFGQAIGSPAFLAPIYNRSGYAGFRANAMRGFHVGVEGDITDEISYIFKGGYRKAWGNGSFLLPAPVHLSSVMVSGQWSPARVKGLTLNASLELDRGNMPCNSFGALVGVKYSGLLNL